MDRSMQANRGSTADSTDVGQEPFDIEVVVEALDGEPLEFRSSVLEDEEQEGEISFGSDADNAEDIGIDVLSDGAGVEDDDGEEVNAEVEVGAGVEVDAGNRPSTSKKYHRNPATTKISRDNLTHRRQGHRVKKTLEKMSKTDGFQVYFKCRYVSDSQQGRVGKINTWAVGANFQLETGKPVTDTVSLNVVKQTLQDIVQPLIPTSPPPQNQSAGTSNQQEAFPSPFRERAIDRTACLKKQCLFRHLSEEEAVWIRCSYGENSSQKCLYWIHAACIGFPGATSEMIEIMANYYCPEHNQLIGTSITPTSNARRSLRSSFNRM